MKKADKDIEQFRFPQSGCVGRNQPPSSLTLALNLGASLKFCSARGRIRKDIRSARDRRHRMMREYAIKFSGMGSLNDHPFVTASSRVDRPWSGLSRRIKKTMIVSSFKTQAIARV